MTVLYIWKQLRRGTDVVNYKVTALNISTFVLEIKATVRGKNEAMNLKGAETIITGEI